MTIAAIPRFPVAERARTIAEALRAPFARLALSAGGEAALARFPFGRAAIRR